MGNNLSVLLNGKVIAAMARKHNFCFYGENCLPTEDEIECKLNNLRQHIISTLVGYTTWLATQENPLTENIDDIVSYVRDLIELFEYNVMVAGRNWVLRDLQDQVDVDDGFCDDRPNFIEIVDDNELYRRQEQDKKDSELKAKYFEDLRKNMLIDRSIADFEVDTLVGEEWEDKNDEYLDRQNRN